MLQNVKIIKDVNWGGNRWHVGQCHCANRMHMRGSSLVSSMISLKPAAEPAVMGFHQKPNFYLICRFLWGGLEFYQGLPISCI